MLPVNTYLLWDADSHECAIVDAGCYYPKEEEVLSKFIEDNHLTVKYLLATHLHFDHSFGNAFVAQKYGVGLSASKDDEFLLQIIFSPLSLFSFRFHLKFASEFPDFLGLLSSLVRGASNLGN